MDDVEYVVGSDALNSFGEYEGRFVFVRNDRLKCDYEILLEQRKYSDVVNKKATRGERLNDRKRAEQRILEWINQLVCNEKYSKRSPIGKLLNHAQCGVCLYYWDGW